MPWYCNFSFLILIKVFPWLTHGSVSYYLTHHRHHIRRNSGRRLLLDIGLPQVSPQRFWLLAYINQNNLTNIITKAFINKTVTMSHLKLSAISRLNYVVGVWTDSFPAIHSCQRHVANHMSCITSEIATNSWLTLCWVRLPSARVCLEISGIFDCRAPLEICQAFSFCMEFSNDSFLLKKYLYF